ncbi:F-box domain-containing protein [Mycena venus]|uniref:F-box domain-containing protein n=1 Tax=Mycena venus TaxID=2733690 RepID=A0A8H6Y7F1_9AGAR|nr:F-box domain-containing protein [Mycena venus]
MDLLPRSDVPTSLCDHCDHALEHVRYDLDSAMSALRHNYSPEGADIDEIILTMAAIDCHFEVYDPEISRLQSILASLQMQKARLQWYQECCRSVIAPIRKLPSEILETIFLACASPQPNVIPVVGQVCRHWRDVAESTPQLWSNISIGRTRFTFSQRYYDLASLFLKRSTTRPLSISIRNPADTRLVSLLFGHADRWGTLRLSSTDKSTYNSLPLHNRALPMLEKLEIIEPTTGPNEGDPVKILHNAPNLKYVVLKNPLDFWDLPWAQLTRLQYDVAATTDAIRILRLCPHLEECALDKLKEAYAADLDGSPIQPLRMRKLRSLRLAVDTVNPTHSVELMMKTFFDNLTTPCLTSLEIIGQWSPTDFMGFLARSACKLTHLTLGPGYMRDDKIIDVLQIVPSLNALVLDADIGTSRQIQNRAITDKLLRRLVFYPDSDCMLPSLTHFSLKTNLNFEDQALLDVIESRWVPWVTELYGVRVARLARVDLEFYGKKVKLGTESVGELKELAEAGLRITLQQGPEKISMFSSDEDENEESSAYVI